MTKVSWQHAKLFFFLVDLCYDGWMLIFPFADNGDVKNARTHFLP